MLLLHPVQPYGNPGKGFPASLFPLQHSVLFLQHQVDVMPLDLIQPDPFHFCAVEQGEFLQPFGDPFFLFHFRERRCLAVVFPTLLPKQFCILGEQIHLMFKYHVVEWMILSAVFPAVRLIETEVTFDYCLTFFDLITVLTF